MTITGHNPTGQGYNNVHPYVSRFSYASAQPSPPNCLPVTGGDPEPTGVSVRGGLYYPGMSPDGHRLTFEADEHHPDELWALENFLPATPARKTTASRR